MNNDLRILLGISIDEKKSAKEINDQLLLLEKNLNPIKLNIGSIKHKIQDINKQISLLEEKIKPIKLTIGSVNYKSKDINQKNSELEGVLKPVKLTIGGLKYNAQELNKQVSNLEKNLKPIKVNITANNSNANQEVNKTVSKVNEAARQQMSAAERFRTALNTVPAWLGATTLIFGTIHSVNQLIDTLYLLDERLTSIKKVLDGADMESVFTNATKAAYEYGRTIDGALQSLGEISKLGFDQQDAEFLNRNAMLLSTVGEFKDDAEAANYLIAIMRQYKLSVEETTDVVSALNEVSNKTGADTLGLAQGLSKSSSAAANAGVSFNELNGMISSTIETLKISGNEAGNFYKTLFTRFLRGDTQDVLEQAGIQVKDLSGELRSATDVLAQLGDKWNTYSSQQKSALGEALGGVYHVNKVTSLLEHQEDVYKNTQYAANSLGSAEKELENFQESLAFKTNNLIASLQELAMAIGQNGARDAIVAFLEGSTSLIQGFTRLTEATNGWNIKLPLLAAGVYGGVKAVTALRFAITGLKASFGIFGLGIIAIEALVSMFMKSSQAANVNTETLEENAKKSAEQVNTLERLIAKYEELEPQAQNNADKHKELQSVLSQIQQLAPHLIESTSKYGDALTLNKTKADQYILSLKEMTKEQIKQAQTANSIELSNVNVDIDDTKKKLGSMEDDVKESFDRIQEYQKKYNVDGLLDAEKDYNKRRKELVDEANKALDEGNKKRANEITLELNALLNEYVEYVELMKDSDGELAEYAEQFGKIQELESKKKGIEERKKAIDELSDSVDKSAETNQKQADSLSTVEDGTYEASDGMGEFSGATDGATESVNTLSDAIKNANGDISKITNSLIEAAKAGQNNEVVTALQGDAYKEVADSIAPLNELLEKMAQGKQISAQEAMELIAQEEQLAEAISIENGIVEINEQAVVSLRDAKVSAYETTMKLIKEEMMQQSKALLEKLGMYKAEIEAIQSVADARAKANELAQESTALSDGDYVAGVNLGMQQNELLNLASNLDKIDQLTQLASSGLTQVGTSAEKLSDSSDKANDKTKESIYISDQYKLAIDAINTALEKQRSIKQKFAEYSKEYQNALKAEIDLLKQQKQLVDSQAKSLQQQIASGVIQPTGIVDKASLSSSGALTVVSSGNYSLGDVRNISSASGADLNKYLTGKLSGMGDVIANAARANGIDPGFLAAIAMHESGKGTSNAIRNKNNAFGIMTSSGIRSFSSLTENINYAADMLRRLYINQGLTTVETIQKKYAPIGASNDPTSLNKYWVNGINTFWKQFTGSITSTAASVGKQVASGVSSSVADYYLKNFKVTSEFGEDRGSYIHKGTDFANGKQGDPVKAIRSGKVITATYSSSAGNWVVVQQDDGTVAKYMHMMNGSLAVKAGDNVVAGQTLGKVGNTGESSGAHLHLQVEKNGQAIDALKYLKSSGGTYGASQDFTQEAAEGLQAIDEAKSSVLSLQQESLQIEQQIQELYMAIVQSKLAEFDHIKDSYDVQIAQYDYLQSVMDENTDKWLHVQMNREAAYVQQIEAEKDAVEYLKEEIKLNKELTEAQKATLNDNLLERQKELISLEQKLYDTRYEMANDIVDTYKKALEAQKEASTKAIDNMIDEINKKADEADYKKKLSNAQKSAQEIQDEITALTLDDSVSAKKRMAELQKELAEQNDSIYEMQSDYDKQLRIDNLNTQKENLSEYYDNMLNDEDKFAQMRTNILGLSNANIVKELATMSTLIQKSVNVLGTSVVNNLIDLINRANGYMNLSTANAPVIGKIEPAKFDSGGYTGSWGSSSGKLAMLHEKELILNKDDTSNFLKAINLTRSFFNNLVKVPDFSGASPAMAGGNTYNLSLSIGQLTGDKKGANLVWTELVKGIKSIGGDI